MRTILILLALLLMATPASAQRPTQQKSFNQSISIVTGNTFQTISSINQPMSSLTIQNNNTSTDNCWIAVSGTVTAGMTLSTAITIPGQSASTAAKVSILLAPGQSYSRYWPQIPIGPIVGTCATAGDSIYVDWQ